MNGPTAPFFRQYTIKHKDDGDGYGYTAAVGNICLASSDSALKVSIEDGKWYDGEVAYCNSIFTPYFRSDSVNVNTLLKNNVAIGIELAPLSVFAGYIRGLTWQQVFKGAMYLCYANGKDIAPHFSNGPECPVPRIRYH